MIGFMRDDGASFIGFPNPTITNGTAELQLSGFGPLLFQNADLYPIPTGGTNFSLNVYNASASLATDTEFRCIDEATAYSAVLHKFWPKAYIFTFNRTYGGYDPNPPVCETPPVPGYPFGNPSESEYFKCHSGELDYVFGGLSYKGEPDRDGLDIPMSQFVGDAWTSFARTFDPNPDPGFLNARGYTNTTMFDSMSDHWDALDISNKDDLKLRVFQVPSFQAPFEIFSSREKCDAFGFPIDFYESNPDGYTSPIAM